MDQGLGPFGALAHALGVAADGAVHVGRHANQLQGAQGGLAGLAAGQAGQPGAGADEIAAGHPFVERVLFRAQADVPVQGCVIPHGMAENRHLALAWIELPRRQLQKRRFAGAVGPQQAGHARGDAERQVVDADDVAVPLGHRAEFDNRC